MHGTIPKPKMSRIGLGGRLTYARYYSLGRPDGILCSAVDGLELCRSTFIAKLQYHVIRLTVKMCLKEFAVSWCCILDHSFRVLYHSVFVIIYRHVPKVRRILMK